MDSGFRVLDCSLFQWNLDSGFQSPGFWILHAKILSDSGIRIPLHGAILERLHLERKLKLCAQLIGNPVCSKFSEDRNFFSTP